MTDDTFRPVFYYFTYNSLAIFDSHWSVSHSRFSEVEVPVNKEKKKMLTILLSGESMFINATETGKLIPIQCPSHLYNNNA